MHSGTDCEWHWSSYIVAHCGHVDAWFRWLV